MFYVNDMPAGRYVSLRSKVALCSFVGCREDSSIAIVDRTAAVALRSANDVRSQGTLIIIMEICKAPTLRLRALNKYMAHIMYIEMENVISKANT